ncbi:nucleotidyltransferase [Methylorubrum rhodesianum]|uniref:nucleotidyltransferase n=1 Tax=Methylorubrum TaxID=2282523 RepID=UPI001611A10D|nr:MULTISPECIES: nucleotidyltransferase [Methylorubrum]MBI1687627.1 nucleotidyltransferase [Methylorubrum sp. DB1722]MDV2982984.1 nucleotidyltransferase [Methylobacteriaceae bacterium AG10]
MSVADNFRAFRANYLIPSATVGTISYRYRRITRQLNKDFWNTDSETAHSLYVGSYGRDTAANGVSDLDVAFTLPNAMYHKYNSYQTNGQSALLQEVKQSVGRTYSTSYVGADGQIIAVNFDDGIRFEFLPVFVNTSNTFTFADSNSGGSWRICDPRGEMAAFAARDKANANGNLKAVCRMARIWRDRHSVPMSGMLIDTLAYQFIAGWPYSDKSYLYHDFLIRDFLLYLSQIDTSQTYWRAPGSSSYVFKKGNFQRQAGASYGDALSAISHESNDRPATARNKWREIFGPTYP